MSDKRIIFMGMGGVYSSVVLKALIEHGEQVAAVVFPRIAADNKGPFWMPAVKLPESDPELEIRPVNENILTMAGKHGIAVLEVGSVRDEATLFEIEKLEPDLVVVACFPLILPEEFLKIAKIGCLNIHPSLLPAYRGPEPLFWQFKAGEKETGVTVHWMDAGVDTGDVLGQAWVKFPEGIGSRQVDDLAAQVGVEMILEALEKDEWPRQPQEQEGGSYQGAPREEDRVISVDWGVQRAFNFMRGADVWALFWIEIKDGERIEVWEALGYELGTVLENKVEKRDGETWVQMRDGVLLVM